MSNDTGAMSNDTGAMSNDTGAMSNDTGAMSNDTGAMSNDTGAMSNDTGAMSNDTGAMCPDMWKIVLSYLRYESIHQCSQSSKQLNVLCQPLLTQITKQQEEKRKKTLDELLYKMRSVNKGLDITSDEKLWNVTYCIYSYGSNVIEYSDVFRVSGEIMIHVQNN